MDDNEEPLLEILGIAHEVSNRGSGCSLRDALIRTRYGEQRSMLQEVALKSLLTTHPRLVEDWLVYSEDKRTDGGWYLLAEGEIGQVRVSTSSQRFQSIEDAVAAYVIRELDFWAGVAG